MTASVGGRMTMVLVGLAVCLAGIIGLLNPAYNEKCDLEEIASVKQSTLCS